MAGGVHREPDALAPDGVNDEDQLEQLFGDGGDGPGDDRNRKSGRVDQPEIERECRQRDATFSAPLSGQYNANGQGVGPSAPCQRPPWGKLVAVNAQTGEIAWESVLGLNEALPEGKQLVGSVGSAGASVTAGGVVFVGVVAHNVTSRPSGT